MHLRNQTLFSTLFSIIALGGFLLPAPAAAQEPTEAQTDEEISKKLLSLIREAKSLQKQEKWAEALALYEQAYKLKPLPALLYPMGKAAEQAGKKRDAIRYYEMFVEALPDEEAARRVAKESLPELKASIPPTVEIVSTPPGANVYVGSIDSSPIGSTPFKGEFEAGQVKLVLKLDGYETHSESLELEGADEAKVNVSLVKRPEEEGVTPPVAKDEKSGSPIKAIGWGTTGVGVALLATGGAFSVLSAARTDDVNSYDKSGAASGAAGRAEIDELKAQANSYYRTSLVTYIAGGVITAVGVGTLAYGMSQSSDDEGSAPEARRLNWQMGIGRQGAWLGLTRTF